MDERKVRLGRAIRRARIWRGLTQQQLATALGVGLNPLRRWEMGEATPSLLLLDGLCGALRLPAEYFRLAPTEDVDRMLLHD